MRLLVLVFASCLHLLRFTNCQEVSVIRHSDGDIFIIEGSCREACTVLSSGTASPYSRSPATAGLVPANNSCTCQCNYGLPTFREDLHICVNDIHECNAAGFVSNSGQVEKVPYVFLPQRGQIIYPQAEIQFEGVSTPVCGIAGAQQLGKSGWSELRNLSDTEPPFRLFRDEGRTFLQWIGEAGLRDAAEGRVVTAKLVCRDASPKSTFSGVFTPCVAFRVAGSPSKNNIREVMFSSTSQVSQGLSAAEYTAIGLSSVLLALIYVASVSLYLHSRKAKRKILEEAEVTLGSGGEIGGLVKSNPLLSASRHFESDTNSGLTESDLGDDLTQSDAEHGFENVTSAIVHPYCAYMEQSEGIFGSGTILGERLPEEDVRVVETVDNHHQQDVPVLPGAQRRKLYFNPAYFDRQLLLAPPPAAIEFLLKIREVISIAKHKMAAKKFVPTLVGIPEEESGSERSESASKKYNQQHRSGGNSIQGSVTKLRKSPRCTGCPGCSDSLQNLPVLAGGDQTNPGESKVRAWLADVRSPDRRWQNMGQAQRNFQESSKSFSRNLEYLAELAKRDFGDPDNNNSLARRSASSWKYNPPMLRTFQNIARSEILENDDRYSISKRSTKSMFDEPSYNRYGETRRDSVTRFEGNDAINAKVREAIQKSFIKQMEENAVIEKLAATQSEEEVDGINNTENNLQEITSSTENTDNSTTRKMKSFKDSIAQPKKALPDMINELPGSKNTAKRIMDAVIREMVDAKSLEYHGKSTIVTDYEIDSLERSKCSRKSSVSPESTDQSSPALSTALPMDEELTMQNAVINSRTGEMTMSKLKKEVLEMNYYNNLPELISQRSEAYSLVSEVYVNDGYASPACSDDSGPEIQYEPENPGHLTIKVQDSPDNYVKQDESEYEPDTLDRKPMKLKVNEDINYERQISEIYVDSLERPAQILLRSKGSFRDQDSAKSCASPLHRGYGSLREIYEARLRSNLMDSNLLNNSSLSKDQSDGSLSWKKCKYLTPESRQAKRQRQPHNQPDVVPLPPMEEIYQRPKPPRRVEPSKFPQIATKNEWDRGSVEAGDPTASTGSPVQKDQYDIYNVGKTTCSYSRKLRKNPSERNNCNHEHSEHYCLQSNCSLGTNRIIEPKLHCGPCCNNNHRDKKNQHLDRNAYNIQQSNGMSRRLQGCCKSKQLDKGLQMCNSNGSHVNPIVNEIRRYVKIEDSGYLSSTDSNGSQKRLLRHEVSSVSETDETESICDGASESGAESVGTESVFFGNFRRLADIAPFRKNVELDVDLNNRSTHFKGFEVRKECSGVERSNFSTSDSETESFITVLPPCESQRSSCLAQ